MSSFITQQTPRGVHTVVYGRVIDAGVKYVEAAFDNGATLRDDTAGGIFALVAVGATSVCEIRLLDATRQVLNHLTEANCGR